MGKINKNDRTQNKIDQHFKEQLRDFNATPPKFMWDNIEQQLNSDREKAKYDHWYYVILALLIPITVVNFLFNYDFEQISDEIFTSTNQKIAAVFKGKNTLENSANNKTASYNNANIPTANTSLENNINSHKATGNTSSGNNSNRNNNDVIASSEKNTPKTSSNSLFKNNKKAGRKLNNNNIAQLSSQESSNQVSEKTILLAIETNEIDTRTSSIFNDAIFMQHPAEKIANQTNATLKNLKGFYVGADARIANNWFLIKQSATNNFINSDVQYQFRYGVSVGGSSGYNFNKNFGIEAEVLYSKQGQSYTDNTFKKVPIKGNIDLTYIRTPLLFKYKWANISATTEKPVVFNILFGPVYSRLVNSEYTVSNEQFAKKAIIPINELGLVFGFEYDLFLSNNSFLTMGLRTGVSSDIHSFPYVGPNALKTLNLDLGLNASYNFQIRPKKKSVTTF